MVKKQVNTIDALFGSKTRVKLLHLFMNNPSKSFYVREITRLVDEQINSVRRELSNLLSVGVITSDTAENKLYYEVNQRYEHYAAFRAMFADAPIGTRLSTSVGRQNTQDEAQPTWRQMVLACKELRLAVAAGVLVEGSASGVDLLLVGSISPAKVKSVIKSIEKQEGRELNYSVMSYDEFYYRYSVRDKFIAEVLSGKHAVLHDSDNVLKSQE